MHRVAFVFSSEYGQTAKIAERMAAELRAAGMVTQLFWLRSPDDLPEATLKSFDAVILGGAIYVGRFSPLLLQWAQEHAKLLSEMTTGFFAVGLQARDPRPTEQETHQKMVTSFLEESGLKPAQVASFAGALRYTKYPMAKRWMMKRISRTVGLPTDTRQDHELTDWAEVEAYARAFANQKPGRVAATSRR